jgi:conjugal transfer pilus assembly protein TraL
MSSPDLSHYIPRRLDDASKFLFWELDVAAIALIGILLGIACELPLSGLVLGLVMAFWYSKLKAGRHPGTAIHVLMWFTGLPAPKVLPKSHLREFNG